MARKTKSAATKANAALVLPDELTIYTVGELHPKWLDWLQNLPPERPGTEVLARAVDQVDAAGLQLLLSLDRALSARGTRMTLTEASHTLRTGCDALGLGDWLKAHEAEEGATA